jgi:hypothetical protein
MVRRESPHHSFVGERISVHPDKVFSNGHPKKSSIMTSKTLFNKIKLWKVDWTLLYPVYVLLG